MDGDFNLSATRSWHLSRASLAVQSRIESSGVKHPVRVNSGAMMRRVRGVFFVIQVEGVVVAAHYKAAAQNWNNEHSVQFACGQKLQNQQFALDCYKQITDYQCTEL